MLVGKTLSKTVSKIGFFDLHHCSGALVPGAFPSHIITVLYCSSRISFPAPHTSDTTVDRLVLANALRRASSMFYLCLVKNVFQDLTLAHDCNCLSMNWYFPTPVRRSERASIEPLQRFRRCVRRRNAVPLVEHATRIILLFQLS